MPLGYDNNDQIADGDTPNKESFSITDENVDILLEKLLKENFHYMEDPLNEIYKPVNPSLVKTKDLTYDSSFYSMGFFVKPDCSNIDIVDGAITSEIDSLKTVHPDIRKMLVSDNMLHSPFIPLLSNFIDFSSISNTSQTMSTVSYGENRFGVKQVLPGAEIQSRVGQEQSLEFFDVSSENLGRNIILNLMKAWFSYINAVRLGTIPPGKKYSLYGVDDPRVSVNSYLREINYMSSFYHFKLARDGKTLVFWSKYTGLYPKGVPSDVFSGSSKGSISKVKINFQTQFYEMLNSNILSEFNFLNLFASSYNGENKENFDIWPEFIVTVKGPKFFLHTRKDILKNESLQRMIKDSKFSRGNLFENGAEEKIVLHKIQEASLVKRVSLPFNDSLARSDNAISDKIELNRLKSLI